MLLSVVTDMLVRLGKTFNITSLGSAIDGLGQETPHMLSKCWVKLGQEMAELLVRTSSVRPGKLSYNSQVVRQMLGLADVS